MTSIPTQWLKKTHQDFANVPVQPLLRYWQILETLHLLLHLWHGSCPEDFSPKSENTTNITFLVCVKNLLYWIQKEDKKYIFRPFHKLRWFGFSPTSTYCSHKVRIKIIIIIIIASYPLKSRMVGKINKVINWYSRPEAITSQEFWKQTDILVSVTNGRATTTAIMTKRIDLVSMIGVVVLLEIFHFKNTFLAINWAMVKTVDIKPTAIIIPHWNALPVGRDTLKLINETISWLLWWGYTEGSPDCSLCSVNKLQIPSLTHDKQCHVQLILQ